MASEPVDYYAVLQVSPSATQAVIEAAYRALVQPDGSLQPDADPLVTEAYQVLSDDDLRLSYDNWYVQWMAGDPDQVRAEARRRARRQTAHRAKAAAARARKAAAEQSRMAGLAAQQAASRSADSVRAAGARQVRVAQNARAARQARAKELPRWRAFPLLHPAQASLAVLVALALVVAGIAIPMKVVADRAEQRQALALAQAQAEEAARQAAAEAEAAAAEEARIRAEEEAAAAEAKAKAEEEAKGAQERAEAAEKAKAKREAAAKEREAAREACLAAVADGAPDLSGCDLSNSDFTGVDFTGRDLSDASFVRSDLTAAIFDDADLEGVRWIGATCPDGKKAAQPGGCDEQLVDRGDANRPLAIGQKTVIGDWEVTVTSYQADAASTARAVDWINSPPGDGFIYAVVGFAVTYVGTGQDESPASDLDFEINGVAEGSSDTHCSLRDSGGRYDRLNTGQSTTFEECMYLPVDTASRGYVGVYEGYSFQSEEPAAYWAIP